MPRLAASMAVLLTVAVSIGFNTARYPVVWEMVAEGRYPEQSAEPSEASPASSSLVSTDSSAPPDEVGSSSTPPPPLETAQPSPTLEPLYESAESTPAVDDLLSSWREEEPTTVAPPVVDPIVEPRPMSPMKAVASLDDQPEEEEPAEAELAASGVSRMKPAEPAGKYGAELSSIDRDVDGEVDGESDGETVPMTGLGTLDEPSGWPAQLEAATLRAAATDTQVESIAAEAEPDGNGATVLALPPLDRVWTPPNTSDKRPIPAGCIPIYPSTDSRGA